MDRGLKKNNYFKVMQFNCGENVIFAGKTVLNYDITFDYTDKL